MCSYSISRRHTFVRGDGESEVQEVGGVGEVSFHGGREVKFSQI